MYLNLYVHKENQIKDRHCENARLKIRSLFVISSQNQFLFGGQGKDFFAEYNATFTVP